MASAIWGLRVKGSASCVCVRLGAITFTRICGASSAASDTASPSTAALAAPMAAWLGKPLRAATEENSTTEAGAAPAPFPAASPGIAACTAIAAPSTFRRKVSR